MGRFVDLSKPLSAEDREYLLARSREGEVEVNDRQFGDLSKAQKAKETKEADEAAAEEAARLEAEKKAEEEFEANAYPEHLVAKVEPLTVVQLRAALKKRGQETSGDKDELRLRLIDYLEEQEKAKAEKEAEEASALRANQN